MGLVSVVVKTTADGQHHTKYFYVERLNRKMLACIPSRRV